MFYDADINHTYKVFFFLERPTNALGYVNVNLLRSNHRLASVTRVAIFGRANINAN
jgi:hypothetical protein